MECPQALDVLKMATDNEEKDTGPDILDIFSLLLKAVQENGND